MRLLKLTCLSLVMLFSLNSCSDDDSSPVNNLTPVEEIPAFPMTAKINGTLFEMKNPFGSDYATTSIYSDYPDEDYIQLQGRPGHSLGMWEVLIWIKREHLVEGTYQVGPETNYTDTHIRLIDNTNDVIESTAFGNITITAVDTEAKIVKGTFEFDTTDFDNDTVVHQVRNGKFTYRYDVEN